MNSLALKTHAHHVKNYLLSNYRAIRGRKFLSKNSLRLSARNLSVFKDQYDGVAAERALQKVVPKPLDAKTTSELVELLKNPPAGEEKFLVDLLLTLDKKTKKNVFSGRVLEIEGLPTSDASKPSSCQTHLRKDLQVDAPSSSTRSLLSNT